MKKIIAGLALLALASVASAQTVTNVWNVNWSLVDVIAPEDTDADGSPALLPDYTVTWSLVYGDNVVMDPVTGVLSGATPIDTMTQVNNGADSYLTWSFGEKTGKYDANLFAFGDTTYLGATTLSTNVAQSVYQYIYITNNETQESYAWLSDMFSVTPRSTVLADGETMPTPVDLGSDVEVAPNGVVGDGYRVSNWIKVTSVPEPATMSLLGLGALAMVLRRKIRK